MQWDTPQLWWCLEDVALLCRGSLTFFAEGTLTPQTVPTLLPDPPRSLTVPSQVLSGAAVPIQRPQPTSCPSSCCFPAPS